MYYPVFPSHVHCYFLLQPSRCADLIGDVREGQLSAVCGHHLSARHPAGGLPLSAEHGGEEKGQQAAGVQYVPDSKSRASWEIW